MLNVGIQFWVPCKSENTGLEKWAEKALRNIWLWNSMHHQPTKCKSRMNGNVTSTRTSKVCNIKGATSSLSTLSLCLSLSLTCCFYLYPSRPANWTDGQSDCLLTLMCHFGKSFVCSVCFCGYRCRPFITITYKMSRNEET